MTLQWREQRLLSGQTTVQGGLTRVGTVFHCLSFCLFLQTHMVCSGTVGQLCLNTDLKQLNRDRTEEVNLKEKNPLHLCSRVSLHFFLLFKVN